MLEAFFLKPKKQTRIPDITTSIQPSAGDPTQCHAERQKKKRKENETEETELPIFTDPLIILRKPERLYRQKKINK